METRTAFAALLLALCAAISRADANVTPPQLPPQAIAPSHRNMVSLGVGVNVPANGVDFHSIPGGGTASNGDAGVQFGAQYLYFVTPRLGAGLNLDYFYRTYTDSPGLFPAANSSVSGDTLLILGILRYTLIDDGWFKPFVLAGAGGARNSTTVDVRAFKWADTGTNETRRLVDDTQWAPAATLRAGLDFKVDTFAPGLVTFEAGWTGLASERYRATAPGQAQGLSGVSGPLNIITFTARYGWRF